MNKKLLIISIIYLLLTSHYCQKFPLVREFKSSKLTFKNNESLVLEINDLVANFFVLADQGGIPEPPYVTYMLTYTSNLMAKLAEEKNTHFQFAIGDNFYFDGVTDVNDKRFQDTFEKAFPDSNLLNTPWFLALGNHDYRGEKIANATAQIEYTYKSKRWILPNVLYDLDIVLSSELLIKAIVIDTQLICDEGTDEERSIYLNLVEKKIKLHSKTNAHYFIVLGHYPVWSAGVKGSNQCLQNKLKPILHRYKVDGYFCGDEHVMQHFSSKYMNQTVEYLVSGATNFVDDSSPNMDKIEKESLKFFWKTNENQFLNCVNCSGAFVVVKADTTKMDLRYINTKGVEIHNFTMYSRRSALNKSSRFFDPLIFIFNLGFVTIYLLTLNIF